MDKMRTPTSRSMHPQNLSVNMAGTPGTPMVVKLTTTRKIQVTSGWERWQPPRWFSNKQVAQGQRAKQAPDGGEVKSQVGPKSQHSWSESRGAWLVVVRPGEDQASHSQPNHNLADLATEIFLRFVSSGFWKWSYCVQFLRNVPKCFVQIAAIWQFGRNDPP